MVSLKLLTAGKRLVAMLVEWLTSKKPSIKGFCRVILRWQALLSNFI